MFQKELNPELLFLTLPIAAMGIVGILFFLGNRKRSLIVQKKLKSKFLFEIENEKIKISRELHDVVAPFTMPLKEMIKNNANLDEQNKNNWLQEVDKFEHYLSNINETIFPPELLEGDLFEALIKLKNRFYNVNTKIEVHSAINGDISKSNSIQIFRIIQESLINAIKYSGSEYINIVNTQKGNDLICFLSYETQEKISINKTGTLLRRGHKIILQRLELLSGKYEVTIADNIKTEKFIFKDIFI